MYTEVESTWEKGEIWRKKDKSSSNPSRFFHVHRWLEEYKWVGFLAALTSTRDPQKGTSLSSEWQVWADQLVQKYLFNFNISQVEAVLWLRQKLWRNDWGHGAKQGRVGREFLMITGSIPKNLISCLCVRVCLSLGKHLRVEQVWCVTPRRVTLGTLLWPCCSYQSLACRAALRC